MLWAVPFAAALCAGLYYAIEKGGPAERCTIGILLCVWVGTLATNFYTGMSAPYLHYAALDMVALYVLYDYQQRNWQWIPGALFASMMFVHLASWLIVPAPFVYQSAIALLAYLQIASVIWASHENSRDRAGRNLGRVGSWMVAADSLPRQRLHSSADARV